MARNQQLTWQHYVRNLILSLVGGAAIQVAAALVWGGRIEVRLESVEQSQRDQDRNISRIDDRGSRQIPQLEQRLAHIESMVLTQNAKIDSFVQQSQNLTPLQQAVLDGVKQSIARIEDQQRRMIEALDTLYSKVTDQPKSFPPNNRR